MSVRRLMSTTSRWIERHPKAVIYWAGFSVVPVTSLLLAFQLSGATGILPYAGWSAIVSALLWGAVAVQGFVYLLSQPRLPIGMWLIEVNLVAGMLGFIAIAEYCLC